MTSVSILRTPLPPSPISRLSPPIKLASYLVLALSLILLPFSYSLAFLPVLFLPFAAARFNLFDELAARKFLLLLPLFTFLARLLFGGTLADAVLNAVYLLDFLGLSLLLLLSTTAVQLRDGLLLFRLPRTLVFLLELALQSLPLFEERLRRVRVAQASRGGGRNALPLLVPFLHQLFDRARTLAVSLESRGFKPAD